MQKQHQERTCIACRRAGPKDTFFRVVAIAGVLVVDYREKLPGRGAHICPEMQCIEKALEGNALSRAFRMSVKTPDARTLAGQLASQIEERLLSLISMAAKSGNCAAGYSAVVDALEKGYAELVLFARDLSEGTEHKIAQLLSAATRRATRFTRDELGRRLNRELVGVVAIKDKGLAEAIWHESERLKSLI